MTERFDTFGIGGPGAGEPDPWDAAAETATDDEGAALDPREAATLLEQTTRAAERQFDDQPALILFVAALTVLLAYGAVWLSVRHQHPYSGPTGAGLAVLYGVLAVWIVFVATVLRRRLSGRSSPRRQLEATVFASVWICVYIFQGALYHADHNHAIAYGVWPAVAPLLVVGAAAAGYQVARGRRFDAALAVAVVALAAIGAFAGPRGVWGVMGVGLCALCLLGGAARYRQRRA
jgi:hypothetical protein